MVFHAKETKFVLYLCGGSDNQIREKFNTNQKKNSCLKYLSEGVKNGRSEGAKEQRSGGLEEWRSEGGKG